MADCSYSRCIQQRRNIRRELQRWTKNMVYIVGLERIAEELMGRRKWKQYQDSMQRNYLQPLNNNVKKSEKYQEKDQAESKGSGDDEEQQLVRDTSIAEQHVANHTPTLGDDAAADVTPKEVDVGRTTRRHDDDDVVTPKREAADDTEDDEDKLNDWSPQSKCYFCVDGKLDEHNNHGGLSPRNSESDSSESPSDVEAPPTLTPAPSLLNNLNNHHHHHHQHHLQHHQHRQARHPHHHHHLPNRTGNMAALESVTSMAALAAALTGSAPSAAAAAAAAAAASSHLPFYNQSLLSPGTTWFQLNNIARNFHGAGGAAHERMDVDKPCGGAAVSAASGEQPLDLSSKGGGGGAAVTAIAQDKLSSVRLPTLDTKHIFNSDFRAKPRMPAVAGRRTYTEDELQAALRDIQTGKLGTRRAAVIYGIPRSTLRNKIDEDDVMDDDKDLSGAEEEKEVEKALERPLLSMADILRFSHLENAEAIKSLLQNKGSEGNALAPYIHNLLMSGMVPETTAKTADGGDLPEVMKRIMAEEHLLAEQLKTQNNGDAERIVARPSPSNSVIVKSEKSKSESDMETDDATSNVILKIPSFKPTSSATSKNGDVYRSSVDSGGSLVSPPVTSESSSPPILPGKGMSLKDVKDVIAKSISQKFQQSPEPLRHPIMDMEYKRGGFTPPLGGISVIKTQPTELSRQYQHATQQPQPQQTSQQKPPQNTQSNSATGGKGTRPKRGKYRNYDRDSLVEAVRAVQRGEMSVHRAGSYYGVPHSTLEYKVKERHLMRPRKRDPKPNPVDEKIASLKQNDIRNAATNDKLKSQVIKPPQKYPPSSPNGIKLPMYDPGMTPIGYNAPPFHFWPHPGFHPHLPLDYGRSSTPATFPASPDFIASQMMQKLQEESRSHTLAANAAASPALVKSARQMAESLLDGAGSNGFLDGIIRSSLESGVPSSDDKREDKNVAPENMSNKTLLDQLCRNSCLTPLTKPSLTESSSGDDDSIRKGISPVNFREKDSENSRDGSVSENHADIQTIELSNDSNDSSSKIRGDGDSMEKTAVTTIPPLPLPQPTGRIYLKQELTKPENLKPEKLVRYREVPHDVDRNGITEGSASESDAAQD